MADSFPVVSVLSYFEGPAENPLSEGGHWQQTTPERAPMKKEVGTVTDSSHGDPNYSHWTPQRFNDQDGIVDVFACTNGGQLGAAVETWRVALWSEVGVNVSGYLLYYGGGISKGFVLRRYAGGILNFTEIVGNVADYPEAIGIRRYGDTLEGWGMFGGVWLLQVSTTDSNYHGNFWAGISIEDPTGGGLGMPCFSFGRKNRTQIYRIIRGG